MFSVMPRVLLLTLISLVAHPAAAALLGAPTVVIPDVPSTPDGFIVNDLLIDFEGRLFGQQMIVSLDSGSLYQDALGGELPPNPAFFPVVPSVQSDTYVAMGGPDSNSSDDVLVVGGSTEFPQSGGLKQFSTSGIDIAWAPATGVILEDRTGFMVARLTLSDDANGEVFYFGNSGGEPRSFYGLIHNGVMCGICPEPSSGLMALLGGVALLRRRAA
ncbi:hypothetical protein MalM25_02230 [Planctomycetes bacterium MalM25]|nr:hypothetical protein MalM25_02230 [Planctomycetes bacterium MalM25]